MFAWQSQGFGELRLGDLALSAVSVGLGEAKFDLSLSLGPQAGGGIDGAVEYDADLFDAVTVSRWMAILERVLKQFSDCSGEAPLASLSLTPPSDLSLLSGFNATERDVPGALLPDLLSDRAAERGSAAAVVFGDASLSYAELEARSNALARELIGRGVGPDAVVAIALPRSF